jgi:hypothetical protein
VTTPRLAIYSPERQAPASAAIERFIDNLPRKPYCSEDPRRFGVRPLQRDIAARCPYIQPNAPSRITYIALDVDKQGAAFVADDAGLPWPTFAVINPKTTHAHLLYELSAPVYPGRSDKADRFLNAVRGGLTEALGADSAYRGLLVQNPLHCRWRQLRTENKFALEYLAAAIPTELLQAPKIASMPRRLDVRGRNDDLFDTARYLAYREVRAARSQDELRDWVLYQCRAHNSVYSPPLSDSEVRATARSITKWVWRHRDSIGSRRHRGVLGLEPIGYEQGEMRQGAVKIYQRAGATYSRARRTLTVNAAIKSAVEQLNREGTNVTVAAIARWAQVSRNSVYRYLREPRSGGCPEGLFSDVHQNEHFQDDTADALIGVCNPEASRFAADDAENRAAA